MDAALSEIGPNKTIEIVTEKGTYTLTTAEEPEPEVNIGTDANVLLITGLEHIVPGSLEFFMFGTDELYGYPESWSYLKYKAGVWDWVSENYPALEERADQRAAELNTEAEKYPRKGYLGINGQVMSHRSYTDPYKDYGYAADFLYGLFTWIFILNLGVGAFNLLPIGPLDGGRMWKIVLDKYMKKGSASILRTLSYLMFIVIILNILLAFV